MGLHNTSYSDSFEHESKIVYIIQAVAAMPKISKAIYSCQLLSGNLKITGLGKVIYFRASEKGETLYNFQFREKCPVFPSLKKDPYLAG